MSSIFYIDVTSCIGCSPEYTYVYSVQDMAHDVSLYSQDVLMPPNRVLGGSKTYRFGFLWNHETVMPYVMIRKTNLLNTVSTNLMYFVDPKTGQPVLSST